MKRTLVIGIPANAFEFGEMLSDNTAAGVREAVKLLKKEVAFDPV